MKNKFLVTFLSVWILLIATGAAFAEAPDEDDDENENRGGAVYTMTNAPDGNSVVIFHRGADGALTKTGSILTGGKGSGGGLDPLGSQNSLVLNQTKKWLLAVNAGSNEISLFRIRPDGLELTDKVDSGGAFPVSVTIRHHQVYVLNGGSAPNITGFTLSKGRLIPLAGSTRLLPVAGAFAQVGFDPQGDTLVVTDKGESTILIYDVGEDGLPAMNPVVSASNGKTPFGFLFDQRGRLVVVEVGPNAVSSYKVHSDETLQVISGSLPNGQKAACWIVGTRRGALFTANPGSGTISAYHMKAGTGQLTLLNGAAGAAKTPLDMATAPNGRFLYALDPGNKGVDLFRIEPDGSLTSLGSVDADLSLFAQGIAAR